MGTLLKERCLQLAHQLVTERSWLLLEAHPPKYAERILQFLPEQSLEMLLGDLEEEYRIKLFCIGRRKADIWYYTQVIVSFLPYFSCLVHKLMKVRIIELVRNLFC